MNLLRTIALSLTLVILVGLTAADAGAETVVKGTFNLPEQAYWNNVRLPAGDYTLTVVREISGIQVARLRGERVAAVVMLPAGAGDSSGHISLTVEDVGGLYVVRQFDAGENNGTYIFHVSKAVRNMTLSGSARPATIPVSTGGI